MKVSTLSLTALAPLLNRVDEITKRRHKRHHCCDEQMSEHFQKRARTHQDLHAQARPNDRQLSSTLTNFNLGWTNNAPTSTPIHTLATKCQQLKHGYSECKKGIVDMRKRFRGNKPIAVSTELEGDGPVPSRAKEVSMLYAGTTIYDNEGVRKTDGREGWELEQRIKKEGYEKFIRNNSSVDWRKK